MSYTLKVKKEISYKQPDKGCCRRSLLGAVLRLAGRFSLNKAGFYSLSVRTRDNVEARWIMFELKELYGLHSSVRLSESRFDKRTVYTVKTEASYASTAAFSQLGLMDVLDKKMGLFSEYVEPVSNICCRYSLYKGAFLSSGRITNPSKSYNLEIVSKNENELERLYAFMQEDEEFNVKRSVRRGRSYIYMNNSEDIATFLSMIGAHNALMDFENTRIEKGIRGETNRIINCDEYNSDRSIDTRLRQVEAIRKIESIKGLDWLDDKLKEIAMLRLSEDYMDYNELADALSIKVSKSTVQRRLVKIEQIAEELE